MEIIIHRVNSLAKLRQIPERYGVEVDVRSFGSKLILNHEPKFNGQLLKGAGNTQHSISIFNQGRAGSMARQPADQLDEIIDRMGR